MKYIIAFLISMIPLVELRGAVPVAIASGIPWWQALILCVIGNMLPVPIIFFFARRVLELTNLLLVASLPGVLKKATVGGKSLKKPLETKVSSGPSYSLWVSHFQEQALGQVRLQHPS